MNFVLVHGGWQGGWCWAAVTEKLRADGHQVFAPTLRGSDNGDIDRSATGLNAIGEALVTELRQQQLTDIVMVGHSGGGPVMQYAADRLAEDTRRVVFISAWVLRDGEAIHDLLPPHLVENDLAIARKRRDRTVTMDPQVWMSRFMNGAPAEQVATVEARLVPVPIGWLTEPISLPRFWDADLPTSYVFLRDDEAVPREVYQQMAHRLARPRIVECEGPHEAMLTHPGSVAAALVRAADD